MDEASESSAKSKSSSSSKSSKSSKSSSSLKSSSTSKPKQNVNNCKDEYTSDFLRQKLREFFNHSDFKSSLQKEAIKEIMRGKRDVYISMPTGSGKSLCFQLPGMLYENKITIVFSPLIALIKDQMDHLTKLKICAESLNSKMTVKERERVINDLKSIKPNTKFLYITPEQAATGFFRSLLDSIVKYNKLALVAVDECHCVSEMGHQFRRDYLKLGELRQRYPTVKWIALTATASKDVTDDVFKQLHLKEPKSFKTPCFRKNLFYDIIYKNSIQDDYIHLRDFASKCLKTKTADEKPNNAPCGIIYCRTRESVERVAVGLSKQNIATKPYHAGLNDKDRKQIQEDWMNGKFPVICATNSFGMGVDKATVRFVVHWDVPQNIAAYYQESGRAGRDGKPSYCRLYYCRQEVKSISFLLNQALQKTPDCVKAKRSVKEFEKLVDHCESNKCRHLLFSQYFGDQAPDCKKRSLCDVCKDPKKAELKLETFHKLANSSFASKMDVDFDISDLYEGGRNAVHEAEASYGAYNEDDYGESSSSKRDTKAKKETTNLIQKEFERRKQKIELAKKLEQTQTRAFGIRIKSGQFTNKIANLDVKKRESYLDFLLKVLKENVEKATEKPAHNLRACDFEDIAAELEYNCFTKNRVLAMYTKAISTERIRIDKLTKNNELLPEIKNHVLKKRTAHGGSSEAMQKDLDDFMKQNNIKDDTNNRATKPSSADNTTHTNVGFQTARQLNNKLKEPNRMKKDPLTQMSINSFFPASAIKREPEDNDENQEQNAKKRRIDNAEVMCKSEPMDTAETECATQQVNVKQEPEDYEDSEDNTSAESDGNVETDISVNKKKKKKKKRSNEQTVQNLPINPVKMEENSENDTDCTDDDESTAPNIGNNGRKSTKGKVQMNEKQPQNDLNNRSGTNETHGQTKQRPVNEHQTVEQNSFKDRLIPVGSFTSHESSTEMIVSEPTKFEDNIKNEPIDDEIQSDDDIRSNEETDDENQTSQENSIPNSPPNQIQNPQNLPSSQNPPNAPNSTIKTEVVDNRYEQYYKNQNDIESNQFQQQLQQEPTSNSIYDSFASTSKDATTMPVAPSAEMYYSRQPISNVQTLITVGTRSKKATNAADNAPIIRFNHIEKVVNEEPQENIVVDEDDDMSEDLIEVFEKYVKDYAKQVEEELAELRQTDWKNLTSEQLKEMTQKLERLKRKKQTILNQKLEEESRKTEEEKERKRDEYLNSLYGPNFDILALDKRFNVATSQRPSTYQKRTTTDQDEKKTKITYNEFMKKTNIKSEQPKPKHGALFNMAANSFVNDKLEKHKLNEIPKEVIKIVKGDKTVIQKRVAKYLMPYYNNQTINKKQYEIICQQITNKQYEDNDYDFESIRQRVDNMVKMVCDARSKAKT